MDGGCHCGAIRYRLAGDFANHTLCHCSDCRRASGAPMVGWIMMAREGVALLQGSPQIYASSEHARRHFCAACGTGLFYTNDTMLPGLIDVQSATLDDPGAVPPTDQIQIAERLGWMTGIDALPVHARYPGMG